MFNEALTILLRPIGSHDGETIHMRVFSLFFRDNGGGDNIRPF